MVGTRLPKSNYPMRHQPSLNPRVPIGQFGEGTCCRPIRALRLTLPHAPSLDGENRCNAPAVAFRNAVGSRELLTMRDFIDSVRGPTFWAKRKGLFDGLGDNAFFHLFVSVLYPDLPIRISMIDE